jgi:hypothetical protein
MSGGGPQRDDRSHPAGATPGERARWLLRTERGRDARRLRGCRSQCLQQRDAKAAGPASVSGRATRRPSRRPRFARMARLVAEADRSSDASNWQKRSPSRFTYASKSTSLIVAECSFSSGAGTRWTPTQTLACGRTGRMAAWFSRDEGPRRRRFGERIVCRLPWRRDSVRA